MGVTLLRKKSYVASRYPLLVLARSVRSPKANHYYHYRNYQKTVLIFFNYDYQSLKQKKTLQILKRLYYYITKANYKAATCFAKLDFKLEALFA